MRNHKAKVYGPTITEHPDNGTIRIAFTIRNTSLVYRMNEQTGEWDLEAQSTLSPASIKHKTPIVSGFITDGLVYVRSEKDG